jgi:hypothetical protein
MENRCGQPYKCVLRTGRPRRPNPIHCREDILITGPEDFDELLLELVGDSPEGQGADGYEFWKAPDLLDEIREGRLRLALLLGRYEMEEFRALLAGLIALFIKRQLGEAHPRRQLSVVHKFIFPQKFEVPWSVVESLSRKYESGHLPFSILFSR